MKNPSTLSSFEPRIRFNWGFWDKRNDSKRRAPLPKDKFYRAGYEYGGYTNYKHDETSDNAWNDFKGKTNPSIRTKHGTVRSKGERGSDYGKPRQRIKGKEFRVGDRVRFKADKSLGTVVRAGAHSLMVKFDDGEVSQISIHEVIHSSAIKTGYKNPGGSIKIYSRCLRIEAVKMVKHSYGGKPTAAGQRYFHDFTTKNAVIYGLPDGSLLIKTK